MNFPLDETISIEIKEFLLRAHLSPEILQIINSSLNADSKPGELFKWAHLTLLSCECVSGVYEPALPGAIAMEFFALAADILDDIQDQDNDELPWRRIPEANAINLATCLLMLSYEAVSTIPHSGLFRAVSQLLNRAGICASDGQYQEFLYDRREKVSLEQYFEVVKKKSGSLTACACEIGAILGGASEELVFQLGQLGTNLGIMSQIRNDLNDFLRFEEKSDFVNHKKTLPYVYLLSVLKGETADQFKHLTHIEGKGLHRFGHEERDCLKKIVLDEGVVHYCTVMCEIFRQDSMEIIKVIPVLEKRKGMLIKIVEQSV